jgi:hypothetical protein
MSNKPFDDAFKDLAEQDAEVLLRLLDAIPPGATVTPTTCRTASLITMSGCG